MVKNKRGDLPVTILVIGVFVVCSLALFSFLVSSFKMGSSFIGIDLMENATSQINEYSFYKSFGISEDKLKNVFNIEKGKLILNKTDSRFSIQEGFASGNWKKEVLLFSVEYEFP